MLDIKKKEEHMYTAKKALLVGILLSMGASGITKAELKDNGGDFRFEFCSTNSCTETHPELQICGNFFSFETKGGKSCDPASSCVSGEGGIFVDHNGTLTIGKQYRATIGTMVTKSGNGVVNLPGNQVFFCNRVGITTWDIDLHDPMQEVIVHADENLAEYTLDWRNVCKDYEVFCPYIIDSVNACDCSPVLPCNVAGVPTIEGSVGQLLLAGSTIASPVTVKVSGGNVGELLFLSCSDVCAASTGVLIVEKNARIGFGTNECNANNLCVPTKLGANGLNIIANGSAFISIKEDVVIDNVCSILKGPEFVAGNVLRFDSAGCCRTITVTKTGVLDLRSFNAGDIIEFGADLNVVLQPGAQIYMDGVTLRVSENARLTAEKYPLAQQVFANEFIDDVIITDSFRVKLIGVGTIELNDCSSFVVEPDAFVGVETLFEVTTSSVCQFSSTKPDNCNLIFKQTCEIPLTDITISLQDNAQLIIGAGCPAQSGGSFQVGNTTDRPDHSVSFTLLINGVCAEAIIRSGGFLGLNLGIAKKSGVPSDWLVDVLFNVNSIAIDVQEGLFAHDRIFSSDSANSSLLGIGESLGSPVFTLSYEENGLIHGGGNLVLFTADCQGPQHPIVRTDDDFTDSCLRVGILASKPLLSPVGPSEVEAVEFFESIKTLDIQDEDRSQSLSNVASPAAQCLRANKVARAGFILNDEIIRMDITDIAGPCACLQLVQAIEDGAAVARVTDFDNPQDASFFSNI